MITGFLFYIIKTLLLMISILIPILSSLLLLLLIETSLVLLILLNRLFLYTTYFMSLFLYTACFMILFLTLCLIVLFLETLSNIHQYLSIAIPLVHELIVQSILIITLQILIHLFLSPSYKLKLLHINIINLFKPTLLTPTIN